MEDFEQELKEAFLEESVLNLEEVESCFMDLETSRDPQPLLDKIFRLAHNMKGGSRSVGFAQVAEFTHELESLVLAVKKGEIPLSTEVVSTLLRSNDSLIEMVHALKSDFNSTTDSGDTLQEIQGWLQTRGQQPQQALQGDIDGAFGAEPDESKDSAAQDQLESPETAGVPEETAFALSTDDWPDLGSANDDHQQKQNSVPPLPAAKEELLVTEDPKPLAKPHEATSSKQTSKSANAEDEVVRVNLSRIEVLNDYVGELIVLQSAILQQVDSPDRALLGSSVQQMAKLTKELQGLAMRLRMLPVKPLIQKLQRVVRDTSALLDKSVKFEVIGEGIDVDKSVLDQIGDPLIHIVRNAVDHGIEEKELRDQCNKSPAGSIQLAFHNEGNHLVITIKDDGKGINTQVLGQKAVSKGLIHDATTLSEKQLINLIFHPGFSTKEVTTEVSGRGVGMDVVKSNIEKMGGQVEVTTELGNGSSFRIQIPLSLAVIEGIVAKTRSGRYVIPLNQIKETVNLKSVPPVANKANSNKYIKIREHVVPIYSMDHLLNPKTALDPMEDQIALIFAKHDRLFAVSVSDLLQSQQIVIKPIRNGIQPKKGWVGSCILGDGMPTLILNPMEMIPNQSQNLSLKTKTKTGAAA